jgi:hypothetical protein
LDTVPWYEIPPEPELPAGRQPLSAATASPADIQNLALALVMMWGPSMRLPAEQRLLAFVEGLAEDRALVLVEEARQASSIGTNYLEQRSEEAGANAHYAPMEEMERAVLDRFPWVDAENLSHLYNQACYYVWHG